MKKHIQPDKIFKTYEKATVEEILFLKKNDKPISMPLNQSFEFLNVYKQQNIPGTSVTAFLRHGLWIRLEKAINMLGAEYNFVLYDAFRTLETQKALFENIFLQNAQKHPLLSHDELMGITRQFVAHPNEPGRFLVPPHNSGGAVDLTLSYQGKILNFGTEFDSTTEYSATDYFENTWTSKQPWSKPVWEEIRANRRMLFSALTRCGFVNYAHEWWHYDLGDCIWAQEKDSAWFYPSMEGQA